MKKWVAIVCLAAGSVAAAAAPEDPALSARKAFLAGKLAAGDGRFEEALADLREAIRIRPEDPVFHYELARLLHDLDAEGEARIHARKSTEIDADFAPAWKLAGSIDLAAADKEHARLADAVTELERAHRLDPQNVSSVESLARAYLEQGAPDRASAALDDVAGLEGNPVILKIRAEAEDKRGADDRARQAYESWMEAEPESREAIAEAIEFYESRRLFIRAIDLLRSLQKKGPDNPAVEDRIAQDLMRSGGFAEAERESRRIIAARPEDRAARRTLASVLYQQGRTTDAEELLKKMIDEDPDDPSVVFSLALQQESEGGMDAAVATLGKLEARLPDAGERSSLKRSVRSEIAIFRLRQKNGEEARRAAAAVAISPDGVEERAIQVLLQISRDEKKPQEGLDWATRALGKFPKDSDFRAATAEFQILAGKKKDGEAELAALAASGIASDVLASSDAWARLKDFDRAARSAGDALGRFAGNADLQFRFASSLERAGKFGDSEKAFQEILSRNPEDPQSLNYLGYMYADKGVKLADARGMLEKAVALDPRNGAYLDSLGWAFFRLNEMERANQFLTQAAARMPDDATVQEHLGDVSARLGRRDDALTHWKKSLTLSPDEPAKIEKKIHDLNAQR